MAKVFDFNKDYHSSANCDQNRVVHFDLDITVDFDLKQLSGEVVLSFERLSSSDSLLIDCRDLDIVAVKDELDNALEYQLVQVNDALGQQLSIQVGTQLNKVKIVYCTSPQAQGLQWLAPEQTLGKQQPYLFSQSQPINARSWIPLQDTPKARVTFNAKVSVPKQLRAVMSALNDPAIADDGVYQFTMVKPIPTHLLAIAVGDLAFKATGKRSGIYTEPGMLERAANEFEDTEAMMQVAESLLGEYAWQRYDMIVLPPSFPFGGMENPMLAFMTPTLIAGDKSLVSIVAHELAHSWTGNLVSNATWRDLWLNEGFTTYFTNRIVEAVYSKEQAELEKMIEYGRLQEELASSEVSSQTLPANVQLGDPNLAFNRFTYDKASMFVHELESRLGRDSFDIFLRRYVEHFAFTAITTETFMEYAEQTLLIDHGDKISAHELHEWVYGTGMPAWFKAPTSDSLNKVDFALSEFTSGIDANKLAIQDWRVHHWQYFLTQLPLVLTTEQLDDLDTCFAFTQSSNSEILCDWFRVAIRNRYQKVMQRLTAFLVEVGRAKFVRPLYLELQIAGMNSQALAIYQQARKGYHPSLRFQLDKLFEQ
ncbi:M1 family peptidase [Shewanella maritima]|uniref:Aminopeptidase N n=1 Tax=Shewanella maritima TaxID=2520507 RepID=A0A411PKK9_9GAMM|nr:M1 family metallopeptidase [Shewanella maritima]QBF84059.1 M1 family peptidase [Shewanella maritima]